MTSSAATASEQHSPRRQGSSIPSGDAPPRDGPAQRRAPASRDKSPQTVRSASRPHHQSRRGKTATEDSELPESTGSDMRARTRDRASLDGSRGAQALMQVAYEAARLQSAASELADDCDGADSDNHPEEDDGSDTDQSDGDLGNGPPAAPPAIHKRREMAPSGPSPPRKRGKSANGIILQPPAKTPAQEMLRESVSSPGRMKLRPANQRAMDRYRPPDDGRRQVRQTGRGSQSNKRAATAYSRPRSSGRDDVNFKTIPRARRSGLRPSAPGAVSSSLVSNDQLCDPLFIAALLGMSRAAARNAWHAEERKAALRERSGEPRVSDSAAGSPGAGEGSGLQPERMTNLRKLAREMEERALVAERRLMLAQAEVAMYERKFREPDPEETVSITRQLKEALDQLGLVEEFFNRERRAWNADALQLEAEAAQSNAEALALRRALSDAEADICHMQEQLVAEIAMKEQAMTFISSRTFGHEAPVRRPSFSGRHEASDSQPTLSSHRSPQPVVGMTNPAGRKTDGRAIDMSDEASDIMPRMAAGRPAAQAPPGRKFLQAEVDRRAPVNPRAEAEPKAPPRAAAPAKGRSAPGPAASDARAAGSAGPRGDHLAGKWTGGEVGPTPVPGRGISTSGGLSRLQSASPPQRAHSVAARPDPGSLVADRRDLASGAPPGAGHPQRALIHLQQHLQQQRAQAQKGSMGNSASGRQPNFWTEAMMAQQYGRSSSGSGHQYPRHNLDSQGWEAQRAYTPAPPAATAGMAPQGRVAHPADYFAPYGSRGGQTAASWEERAHRAHQQALHQQQQQQRKTPVGMGTAPHLGNQPLARAHPGHPAAHLQPTGAGAGHPSVPAAPNHRAYASHPPRQQ